MARRIDGASKSWLKGLRYGTDTTKLANDLARASRSLSRHVAQMQSDLAAFVAALEKAEVRKKPSMARHILRWLKDLFDALASIFALGSFVSPFLHSVAPGVGVIAPAASALWKAAAAFCGVALGTFPLGMHNPPIYVPGEERSSDRPLFYIEMHEGKECEGIESVLQFLKETVPKEAQTAQKRLARFDEALVVMGLEARMKTGRRVALRGPDSAAIAQEWTNVAKQYQSMLPDADDDSEDSSRSPE